MLYVVDEIKRCGLPARPTLRRARRKARKHLPPTANPVLTTMHSSTLANDFSFCPTLASASFQPLPSRGAPCLSSKSRVLTLLRTLFLSLHSFRRSPHLFSTACGLFLQNTGGMGYLCDISAPSAPLRYHLPLSCGPFIFIHLQIPPRRASICNILCFPALTNPFFQLLWIHVYTKRPGVTPPHNFSADPTRIGIPTERSDEGRFPHVIPRLRPAKPRGIRHFPQPVLSC